MTGVHNVDIEIARERLTHGDFDRSIELSRAVVDELCDRGSYVWTPLATAVLAEALFRRGRDGDLEDAIAAIDRMVAVPIEPGLVLRNIWLLRLQALSAKARGDETAYRELRDDYRALATSLGFEGHMNWAGQMP